MRRLDANLVAYAALTVLILVNVALRYGGDTTERPKHFLPQISPDGQASGAGVNLGNCGVSYVFDGDTLELTCGTQRRRARLTGFDAPETHPPRCKDGAALGARAGARLQELVAGGDLGFTLEGHDQYGRDLVAMKVSGRDVAEIMISEGLAVAYDGGARIGWCARLAKP